MRRGFATLRREHLTFGSYGNQETVDTHGPTSQFALVAPPFFFSETAGKWGDIRINSHFSSEMLLDLAELDSIRCIVGDDVEKACERNGQLRSGMQRSKRYIPLIPIL